MFRKGDIIRLEDDTGMHAQAGAMAVVIKEVDEEGFITVHWNKKDPLAGEQDNGRYYPRSFERALQKLIPRFKQVAGEL